MKKILSIFSFLFLVLIFTESTIATTKHKNRSKKHHRKLHHEHDIQGNPIVSQMNQWQNPYFGSPIEGNNSQIGNEGQLNPVNPMMAHPQMSGMMSPYMMNAMRPDQNPYMLGMYGSYHPGNMLHPLHPFNPYNSYAGMAFNPMMSGPYGFGGATYMDSYIDGPVNRLLI